MAGKLIFTGASPYPKYYDISTGAIWSNSTSWDFQGPSRINVVQNEALFNDYQGGSGQFVSLDVVDGSENWANSLGSSGYEVILTADPSLENYYWGDGYGGANGLGKNDASTLVNEWKLSQPRDIIDIKVNKSGSYIYNITGFGTGPFPVYKIAADSSLAWTSETLGLGNNAMDIDLDEEYVVVGGTDHLTKIAGSDGSINWQWELPGYTTGVAAWRPSIADDNNVYACVWNSNVTDGSTYLLKVNGNGEQQWLKLIATDDAAGDYTRKTYTHLAKDGNIWVLGYTASGGPSNPPITGYMYKYRATDGILMERWQISEKGTGRPDNFDVVEGTNDVIVIFSSPDTVKKFQLE